MHILHVKQLAWVQGISMLSWGKAHCSASTPCSTALSTVHKPRVSGVCFAYWMHNLTSAAAFVLSAVRMGCDGYRAIETAAQG